MIHMPYIPHVQVYDDKALTQLQKQEDNRLSMTFMSMVTSYMTS